MFGAQRIRLIRENDWTANELAQELFAMFADNVPLEHNAPIVLTASSPAFIFKGWDNGDTIFHVQPSDGAQPYVEVKVQDGLFLPDNSGIDPEDVIRANTPWVASYGGTGRDSFGTYQVLIANGTDAFTGASLLDGQLLVGVTDGSPIPAYLVNDGGVTIRSEAGVIGLSVARPVATQNTGTTTDSFVALFTETSSQGLIGMISVKNTGASFGLDVKIEVTDLFGASDSLIDAVGLGVTKTYNLASIPTMTAAYPPYTSVTASVRATVSGSQTTYEAWRSIIK